MVRIARSLGDPSEPWLWIDAIAWVLDNRDQFDECLEALNAGRPAARRYGNREALILADAFETRVHIDRGDLSLANETIERALGAINLESTLKESSVLRKLVGARVASAHAKLKRAQGDVGKSVQFNELALELRSSIGEMTAGLLSNLAYAYLTLGDLDMTEEYLRQAREVASRKDAAWINLTRALLYEARNELSESIQLAQIAYEQFEMFGLSAGMRSALELIERLGDVATEPAGK